MLFGSLEQYVNGFAQHFPVRGKISRPIPDGGDYAGEQTCKPGDQDRSDRPGERSEGVVGAFEERRLCVQVPIPDASTARWRSRSDQAHHGEDEHHSGIDRRESTRRRTLHEHEDAYGQLDNGLRGSGEDLARR